MSLRLAGIVAVCGGIARTRMVRENLVVCQNESFSPRDLKCFKVLRQVSPILCAESRGTSTVLSYRFRNVLP